VTEVSAPLQGTPHAVPNPAPTADTMPSTTMPTQQGTPSTVVFPGVPTGPAPAGAGSPAPNAPTGGAGPNGPGTGNGPATPVGPATGTPGATPPSPPGSGPGTGNTPVAPAPATPAAPTTPAAPAPATPATPTPTPPITPRAVIPAPTGAGGSPTSGSPRSEWPAGLDAR
jgi:hypothetical protein